MEYQDYEYLADEVYDFLLDGELEFDAEFESDFAPEQPLDYVVEPVEPEEIYYDS